MSTHLGSYFLDDLNFESLWQLEDLEFISDLIHFISFLIPETFTVLDVHAFERLLGPCMGIMQRNIKDYEQQESIRN